MFKRNEQKYCLIVLFFRTLRTDCLRLNFHFATKVIILLLKILKFNEILELSIQFFNISYHQTFMCHKLKIQIRWPNKAILPVLIDDMSSVLEIAKLLEFSCFQNERIILLQNGKVLNYNTRIQDIAMKGDEIFDCCVVDNNDYLNNSIIREMARVLDIKNDMRENQDLKRDNCVLREEEDDESLYSFLDSDSLDLSENDKISLDPLPPLWDKEAEKR